MRITIWTWFGYSIFFFRSRWMKFQKWTYFHKIWKNFHKNCTTFWPLKNLFQKIWFLTRTVSPWHPMRNTLASSSIRKWFVKQFLALVNKKYEIELGFWGFAISDEKFNGESTRTISWLQKWVIFDISGKRRKQTWL